MVSSYELGTIVGLIVPLIAIAYIVYRSWITNNTTYRIIGILGGLFLLLFSGLLAIIVAFILVFIPHRNGSKDNNVDDSVEDE